MYLEERAAARIKKEAEKDKEVLRTIELFSLGLTIGEMASGLNTSTAKVYARRSTAQVRLVSKFDLPEAFVQRLLKICQPNGSTLQKTECPIVLDDREGAVILDRALKLYEWEEAAESVIDAQTEMLNIGLSDLERILRDGLCPPFVRTFAFKWLEEEQAWRVFEMDDWGRWTSEQGEIVAEGGPDALPNTINFVGQFSPDELSEHLILGVPIVIDGQVIGNATCQSKAVHVSEELHFDRLEESGVNLDDLGEDDFPEGHTFTYLKEVICSDTNWQALVARTGAWVAKS